MQTKGDKSLKGLEHLGGKTERLLHFFFKKKKMGHDRGLVNSLYSAMNCSRIFLMKLESYAYPMKIIGSRFGADSKKFLHTVCNFMDP